MLVECTNSLASLLLSYLRASSMNHYFTTLESEDDYRVSLGIPSIFD